MKKLLDSDWSESSAFQVYHQCKLHIAILDCDWLKDNMNFSRPMISRKVMTKSLCGKLCKEVFSNGQKRLEERSSSTSSTQIFFHVYIVKK